MIWQCTEILAVIVECMIVTRMLIQYFKFRSERLSDSEMASLVFVVVCNRYGRNFRNSKRNIFDFQLSVD